MKAFPNHRSEGMELRDYFAAKAMVGQMWSDNYEEDAKNCYKIADAMMKARKESSQNDTK